jgi:predicted transcriptional regulator
MKGKVSIRISDNLRDKLSETAELKGVSVSELSRTILEQYFEDNNTLNQEEITEDIFDANTSHEEINENNFSSEKLINQDIDIVNSLDFFQLVIWMYDQRGSRILRLDKVEFEKFKNTIIKIHISSSVKDELKNEFNKVFVYLIKEINKNYSLSYRPDFAYGSYTGFDYSLLTEFIFKDRMGSYLITI